MKTYKKYLVSEKRNFDKITKSDEKKDLEKIQKVINSLSSKSSKEELESQIKIIEKMIINYSKLHGYSLKNNFKTLIVDLKNFISGNWDDKPEGVSFSRWNLSKELNKKIKKIKHEKSI